MKNKSDFEIGYNDRLHHVYDKWFRYNRSDGGKQYDKGVRMVLDYKHSEEWYEEDKNFRIIEVN